MRSARIPVSSVAPACSAGRRKAPAALGKAGRSELHGARAAGAALVLFGGRAAQRSERAPGRGRHQRLARPGERIAERAENRLLVRSRGATAPGAQLPGVEQREVDHAVSLGGRLPEAIEIIEVTPAHRRAQPGHRGRGLVRAGQADDLMAGRYEYGDQCGRTREGQSHEQIADELYPVVENRMDELGRWFSVSVRPLPPLGR